MLRHYERARTTGRIAPVVKRLAAVAAVCLLMRAVADRVDGRAAFALTNGGSEAVLKTELPLAWSGNADLGAFALRMELPGTGRITAPEPAPEDNAVPPDKGEKPPKGDMREPQKHGNEKNDETDQPAQPAPEDNAVDTTITGEGGGYEYGSEGIYIKNNTDYAIDVDTLLSAPLAFEAEGAHVLIVHTHGSEAYTPSGDDIYEPSDPSRTEDKNYNVVRVGDELERILTERGITVIHDRDLYDYPSYAGSYTRSMEAIAGHLAEDPDIRVVIDLHRDALVSDDGTVYKTVADIGDTPSAQVMIIAGTDFSGLEHDEWRSNLSFALKIQAEMVAEYPTLARPLSISQYRYNQNATTGSLIAEVGCNGNTLQEALTAVRYFGECLANVLVGK